MIEILIGVAGFLLIGGLFNRLYYMRVVKSGILANDEEGPTLPLFFGWIVLLISALVVLAVLSLLYYFDFIASWNRLVMFIIGGIIGAVLMMFWWSPYIRPKT